MVSYRKQIACQFETEDVNIFTSPGLNV